MAGHPFPEALALVDFWREAGASKWFMKDSDFDAEFDRRYADLHFIAARRQLEPWLDDPYASLALVLLLDQFPRNAFRDTGHMFATDGLARRYARRALNLGHVRKRGRSTSDRDPSEISRLGQLGGTLEKLKQGPELDPRRAPRGHPSRPSTPGPRGARLRIRSSDGAGAS